MKEYAKKNRLELVFLLLQTILYVSFLYIDLTGGSVRLSTSIKYTIILLCFCYALLSGGAYKGIIFFENRKGQCANQNVLFSDTIFLQAGLFFTLISDLLILILDYYFYGVLVFILVQQLYCLRLVLLRYEQSDYGVISYTKVDKDNPFFVYGKQLMLQLGFAISVCLALYLAGVVMEGLIIVSVFYFISILSNTVHALRYSCIRKERSSQLYALGMLLFLLCDINVGLFNLTGFIELSDELNSVIYSISSILMWTFYAPSQVMIALSCHNNCYHNNR